VPSSASASTTFAAIVVYLKAVNWSFPGCSLKQHRGRLRALYRGSIGWPVMTSGHRFLLVAPKPGSGTSGTLAGPH
jgi:hypothetical protein